MAANATSVDESTFDRRIRKLVELSVGTGHDAFEDVPWQDPEFAVEPDDPRLAPYPFDPLVLTDSYREWSAQQRTEAGRLRTASAMRIGWEFENLLQQGLLIRAYNMDNEDPAFAYVHHEVIEESQHSMMFYEFVRRYAPDVPGMPTWLRRSAEPLVQVMSRAWPNLFFLLVLAGEIPIDYLQRRAVREVDMHPLVERIMRIHVEEEARHVSYANQELRRRVPEMSAPQRQVLALVFPALLGVVARLMVHPSPWVLRTCGVSRREMRAATREPRARTVLAESVGRIRSLCGELGLLTPAAKPVWRLAGLLDPADGGR